MFSRIRPFGPLSFLVLHLLLRGTAFAQYQVKTWTTEQGLPQSSVYAITQTRDGFLWVSTFGGLARFDGTTFRTFDTTTNPELPSSRFEGVFADANGTLWAMADHVVTSFADGRFRLYGVADGLPMATAITAGMYDGQLLVQTAKGFVVWDGRKFVPDAGVQPSGIDPSLTRAGFAYRRRAEWFRDAAGNAYRYAGGRVTRTVVFPGTGAYEDQAGRLWAIQTGTGRLRCLWPDGSVHTYGREDGMAPISFLGRFEEPDGTLWFFANTGPVRFKDGRFISYTTADGLPDGEVRSMFRDREGSLWVATNKGLARLTERAVVPVTAADGLTSDNVYPILQDRTGDIWIGAWKGLTRLHNGRYERITDDYLVTALMEDRAGTVWIGTFGKGIWQFRDGRLTPVAGPRPLDVAFVIYQAPAGDVWFGTQAGPMRLRDGVYTRITRPDGTAGGETYSLHDDGAGTVWIGNQQGLARFTNGTMTQVTAAEGFTGTRVRAIRADKDGTLWFGTYDSGLFRYRNGRFTRYTTRDGLPANGAFQMLEDDQGRFWISSNSGIYRVTRSDLEDVAAGRRRTVTAVRYGREDGMVNQECNGLGQPAGIRARDGRLWFPTQGGVATIDPRAVGSHPAPPIWINEVMSGGTSFQAQFTAITFVRPELAQFRYRMEGVDPDWIDAGVDRHARYSQLPYGRFRFRVIGANRDGVWNEEGASVDVNVVPPFWRTRWFLTLMIGLVVAGAFSVHRARLGLLQRRQRAQEAFARQLIEQQETDRARIASGLHDGLTQSLIVIKNWALMGQRGSADEPAAHPRFADIEQAASHALGEVREVVRDLVPYHLERVGLADTVEEMVERIGAASGIQFSSRCDPLDQTWPTTTQVSLYRIIQEAVNNVVKHSGAAHAGVDLSARNGGLVVTIHDDGRGCDVVMDAERRGGGFGLVGMSERARLMGGQCRIESRPGHGTTIIVDVPHPAGAGGAA